MTTQLLKIKKNIFKNHLLKNYVAPKAPVVLKQF